MTDTMNSQNIDLSSWDTLYILFFFFRKSCRLWHNVEKYCKTGQPTDDNMEHAHFMLDSYGYEQTLRIHNTYCFSTATKV